MHCPRWHVYEAMHPLPPGHVEDVQPPPLVVLVVDVVVVLVVAAVLEVLPVLAVVSGPELTEVPGPEVVLVPDMPPALCTLLVMPPSPPWPPWPCEEVPPVFAGGLGSS